MTKISFWCVVIVATVAILSSVVDWVVGLLAPHTYWLIGIGLAVLVGLGIWEWWTRKFIHPFLAFTSVLMAADYVQAASSIDEILTPPEKTPILRWNPTSMIGSEFWALAFGLAIVIFLAWLVVKAGVIDTLFPRQ